MTRVIRNAYTREVHSFLEILDESEHVYPEITLHRQPQRNNNVIGLDDAFEGFELLDINGLYGMPDKSTVIIIASVLCKDGQIVVL